jgi:hypothetical protein
MNLSSGADTHKSESLIPQRSRGHQPPAQSLSVIAQRWRDHASWAAEAARIGTDLPSVVRAALEMMIAAGIIEQPEPKTMTAWDGPSWRASAKDYHEQRASRRTSETINPERLAHLRRLMADDISINRAWHELEADRTAPKATVEALMFSLRRGINELTQPSTLRRLSTLDEYQLEDVCLRVQAFQQRIAPAWSAADVDLLISAWRKFHGQR